MTPLMAGIMSTLSTLVAVANSDPLPKPQTDLRLAEACTMSIVLVGVDDTAVGRTIDRMTGGLGFSHCYFDPCRVDELGRRRIVGYSVAKGVHWADPAEYKADRRQVRVELDARTGAEVWGCVRARFGRPLRVTSLVLGVDSAATCVGLIVGCLPWQWQQELRELQVGPCISPNTLAAYFGVT